MLVKIKKPELEERSLEELLRLHAEAASKFVALKKQPRVGIFWYNKKNGAW